LNLLSNAVKFTPDGSVSLKICRMPSAAEPEHLRFAIADTGPGVSADAQQLLFQQFAQADSSICREHGGTGLGLSICKSLVELMGGRIGFESNEAGGSTFWFEIQLESVPKPPARREHPQSRTQAKELRILLVEDVAMNQELACAVLRRVGHAVDVANDGVEAIAAVREHPYDVILMDIQMPRMDGITAARSIRQLSGPAGDTPIIALTANAMPEKVLEYYDAGMVDHVTKPFKQRELHEAIQRAVDPLAKWHRAIGSMARSREHSGIKPASAPTPSPNLAVHETETPHPAPNSVHRDESAARLGEAVDVGLTLPITDQAAIPAPEPDPAVFDTEMLAQLRLLIPNERVEGYLQELDRQLSEICSSNTDDTTLQGLAHKMVSQAGSFGLLRVSDCARSLESACRSGSGRVEAQLRCKATAADVRLFAIPALRSQAVHAEASSR
jgi:CheY-like chemotaxis protein/HPt (histidine-containing phosphotransfer) domain-containing protein